MTIPENTGDFATEFKDFLDCFVVVGGTARRYARHFAKDKRGLWADEDTAFFEPCCGYGNIVISIYKLRDIEKLPFYAVANAEKLNLTKRLLQRRKFSRYSSNTRW